MCESSAPSAPTDKQTQVTELPEWARPYAKNLLARGSALTDINQNPYQTYGANRIAGFSPMQQRSMQDAANMQPSQQLGTATDLASAAGVGALGANYAGGQFSGGKFGQTDATAYMNPYQQSVTDINKREAARQSGIQGTQQQAQAAQSGAFGGSRDAIMRAERERNLSQQMGDIQAQGQNAAYTNAQQQFNADQARGMQAQQLGEQSRQYGAGLGMQGFQTALQGASQLGQLGGQQFQQGMDINKLQNVYGGQMQQQAQRPLDQAYQDFQNQQNNPYKQLGFMSDLVRGLPLGQQSTSNVYQGPGSAVGQLAGLGMGAYGVSQLMKADGGMVHDYAEGGVTSDQNVEGILSKLSDQQLEQAKQGALARRDVEQANMIDAEMAMRASARNGIGAGIPPEFADQMEESMATGGIVAFADKGAVEDKDKKYGSVIGKEIMEGLSSFFDKFNPSAAGYSEEVGQTPEASVERSRVLQQAAKVAPPAPRVAAPSAAPAKKASVVESSADKAGIDAAFKQPTQQAAAKKSEPLFSGPKPSKAEVKSAVAQFAEQQGATKSEKEDYMATALRIREELGKQNQPILDKLNAAIDAQKPDERALKDRGIGQALAQFGFAMADRASKPGATFLGSAAGASPVLASVAEKTNSLIDAQKQNYTNLRLDQAKYEVALAKGDMQTAATLAGQIRQANQQDQMLQFQIAKANQEFALKERELAQTASAQNKMASRYETIGSLTRDIMQNEGLPYDKALEKAGRLLKPTGYAADTKADASTRAALATALNKVEAEYPAIARTGPSKFAQGNRAAYENAMNNVYRTFGAEPQGASNASTISPSAFKIEKIGK